MNNKEFLIHILLELRSKGIKNQSILKIIESIPPHYYLSLYSKKVLKKNITISELIEITKLLELAFTENAKYENILVVGIKKGWLLALASKLSKRVYSLCDNLDHKKILEKLFYNNNLNNIYLKVAKDFISWKEVSPFDIIIYLKGSNCLSHIFQKYLSKKGIALVPNMINENDIKFVMINKELEIFNTTIKYEFLEKSDLI